MKFSKVIGKFEDGLVEKAEEKLTQIFLELGAKHDNEHVGSKLGGDICLFTLLHPVEHICTANLPTAATDGKRFYWNPKFVLKHSRIGLRLIAGHEGWHALYMHPMRRGSRIPKLWNIAVDYIVNGVVMEDLKVRKKDPKDLFQKNLGKYMTLKEYAELLKDPFAKQKGFEEVSATDAAANGDTGVKLPAPMEDRELTADEQKELERREKKSFFFFADPDLEEDMKRPEKIYDYLYSLLPKCPECGAVGIYKNPKGNKGKNQKQDGKGDKKDKGDKGDKGDQKQQGKGNNPNQDQSHDHGDGSPCDCKDHGDQQGDGQGSGGQGDQQGQGGCDHNQGCGTCGEGGLDIFDLGGTIDDHMDSEETQEKLAKRLADAIETARKMAGHVPAGLEDELGLLSAPVLRWQDIVRTKLNKARAGGGKNDWTRFRTRPMFSGMLVPKRKSYFAKFGCLLDTSGSMSQEDMAFGVSQLQSLDERTEGTLTSCDCTVYWDSTVELKKFDKSTLQRIQVQGRGGTMLQDYINNYEEHIGKVDFILMITDGYLSDQELVEMKNPSGVDIIWLITSNNSGFRPPFGRVFQLRN